MLILSEKENGGWRIIYVPLDGSYLGNGKAVLISESDGPTENGEFAFRCLRGMASLNPSKFWNERIMTGQVYDCVMAPNEKQFRIIQNADLN